MAEDVKWERFAFGQWLLNSSFTADNKMRVTAAEQAIKIKRPLEFTLINRVQLWTCEKQLNSIEFRRKKIFRRYFLALELKKSQ